jgi:hypothetical protein
VWYVLLCILTLGTPYFVKIGRKKALIEVYNLQIDAHRQALADSVYSHMIAQQEAVAAAEVQHVRNDGS